MESNVNKDRVRIWARALKSGQYEQGFGTMRSRDGKYCCLGVAMDLAYANGCPLPENDPDFYWGKYDSLPEGVAKWYGLPGRVRLKDSQSPVESGQNAASLNDNGVPFPKIADQIIYTYELGQDD